MPMTQGDVPESNDEALKRIARELPVLRSEVRMARRSWRFTTVVMVVAILTGGFLFWQRLNDQRTADVATCERSNVSRQQIGEAFDHMRDALEAAGDRPGQASTSERQAALDKFNADIDRVVQQFGPRNCAALYGG